MAKTQSLISRITPINLKEEREKFLFDSLYNPQFEYRESIEENDFSRYGNISHEYFSIAQSILNKVIHQWGDAESYNQDIQGSILTQPEAEEKIKEYLQKNNLQDVISYQFSHNYIARTSVYQNTLRIRTPVQYRENGIESVLDHEIGTHIFRRLNDMKQPWHKKYTAFGFKPYLSTEEGLAVIHAQMSLPDRLLFFPALNYYAVCQGEQLSFSELFADLKKYLADRQKRFNICLRVKRGISDTSIPGAFSKNQVYLEGVIHVIQWLVENEYAVEKLYLGKIDVVDVTKAWTQSTLAPSDVLLPSFLKDSAQYKAAVLDIIKVNKLPIRIPAAPNKPTA